MISEKTLCSKNFTSNLRDVFKRKEYTGLQSHFRSANYTAFIRRRNHFDKTDSRIGSKNEKRSYGKVTNNKTTLIIYSNSLS